MKRLAIVELSRSLSATEAIAIVVGTVIGSGIFLVPKTMVAAVGEPWLVIAVFLFGGLLSLAGALTYAELAAAMPQAGGEYVYLREGYGRLWSFLYGWTQFWVAKSGGVAALATAFYLYLANFHPVLEQTWFVIPGPLGEGGKPLEVSWGQLVAIGLILFLGGVNYLGVKLGGRIQSALTILKLVLILSLVGLAAALGGGSAANLSSITPHIGGVSGFFAALVAALWAYDGWNNVAMAAGEVREPQRNLPRALIGGVLIVMAVYAAVNLAYFYVLSADEVAASDRVASEAARRFLGTAGAGTVAAVALVSIFAALNGSILTGARVPYAMAKDGYFFRSMAAVHPVRRTPHIAILALSCWSALLVLSGRYDQLFTYVIFASWILYAMTAAAVIVLRHKRPDMPRPYRTLGYPAVPVLFVGVAAMLIAATLYDSPRESLLGLAIVAAGIPAYFYWHKKTPSQNPSSRA